MTNLEKWRFYMKDISSPDSFIDAGFYYMVSAALQRRVWIGSEKAPIFPNLYLILVAEPGIGKGLVINQVSYILKYHKKDRVPNILGDVKPENKDEATMLQAVGEMNKINEGQKQEDKPGKQERPLLIPVAADAITYEKLVNCMAQATRIATYRKQNPLTGKSEIGYITHASLCFCLEEISSLFRTHTQDLVNFLLVAFDCRDYTYETIGRGQDKIIGCCLNFFGGTTPGFIQRVFGQEILTEGFSSRAVFIYEPRNRFEILFIPDFSEEQIAAQKDIIEHVKKLTNLYGQVKLTPEALEFVTDWWCNKRPKEVRPNMNSKLNHYYSRKNLHVLKWALAVHFADSISMEVTLEDVKKAMEILDKIEVNMHQALSIGGKNPIAPVAHEIVKFINKRGPQTKKNLLLEFFEQLPKGLPDLNEALEYLTTAGRIMFEGQKQQYNTTKK